jgi:hypothetical protein
MNGNLGARLGVPCARRAIARPAGDHRAVGAEAGILDLVFVSAQEPDLIARGSVPQPDDAPALGGDDLAAVGADVGGIDDAGQPLDRTELLICREIPDLDIVGVGVAVLHRPRRRAIDTQVWRVRHVTRLLVVLRERRIDAEVRCDQPRTDEGEGAEAGNNRAVRFQRHGAME